MKKVIIGFVCLLLLAGGAILIRQNLPEKRFARHLSKARILLKQYNLTSAKAEYEKAYSIRGGYSPTVSLEVLQLENVLALKEKNIDKALKNTMSYTKDNPKDIKAWIILARMALNAGDFETAFNAINTILDKSPENFTARAILAQFRAKQGRMDLAEKQLRLLHENHPDSLPALMPLAEVLIKQGKTSEARPFLEKLIRAYPNLAQAYALLIDTYILERNLDSIHAVLDKWVALDSAPVVAIAIRKSRLLFLTGKQDEAQKELKQFSNLEKENLPIFFELAKLKAKQENYDSALAIYKKVGEEFPQAAERARILSHFLNLKTGNPAQALTLLKMQDVGKANSAYPRNYIMCYLALDMEHKAEEFIASQNDSLVKVLKEFRSQVDADKDFIGLWALISYYQLTNEKLWVIKTLNTMYAKWPAKAVVYNQLAQELASIGNLDGAMKILERVSSPSQAQQVSLLSIYLKTGKSAKALAMAKDIIMKYPETRGINTLLADFYYKQDNKATYISYLKKEIALNPGDIKSLNNLAWQYGIEEKNFETARLYLDKLRALKPKDPRVLDTIGWVLAQNGEFEEALPYLKLALNLVPDYPNVLYHMGWLQVKLGKPEKAAGYLKMAISSKLPFSEKSSARQLLNSLEK